MTELIVNSSEETRSLSSSLWLWVGTLLVLGPELASRRADHSLLWRMSLYIFDILFLYTLHVCVIIFWPLSFSWLLVFGIYTEDYLQILNVCPFDYTAFRSVGRLGSRTPVKPHQLGGYRYPNWGRRGFKSRIRPPYPQLVVKGD